MDRFATQALAEYNSDDKTVRHGGQNGRVFWNTHASQFMFVPAFQFRFLRPAEEYIYTATDCNGKQHSFTDTSSCAPLTPIWKDIPVGIVELKVEVRHMVDHKIYSIGSRTFYKTAPFPGRDALPKKACSYRECAIKAFRYAFRDPSSQYWLQYGKPDPEYYHNVYPSKMIDSLVRAMISYSKLEPEMASQALQLAKNAADYLLSITYSDEYALAGMPPTYSFKGLNKETVNRTAPAAEGRQHQVMMIYPAMVGSMYLALEEETGDKKYFDAAYRIAEHYKKTVLPSGSWYLMVTADTNEPETVNCCNNFSLLEFMNAIYHRTGEACWHELERNYFSYLCKTYLENYNWEGQFEDSKLTEGYLNLTHIEADKMISYIAANMADDPEMVKEAEQLMRFVEDQFVVWGDFAPWSIRGDARWYSPAGLEQYFWYVPIDANTAAIIKAFLDLYSVTHDELLLEKACALGDSITRMQEPVSGVIPTHWMKEDCATNLDNFWINCHIGTAFSMMKLAEVMGEI